MTALLAVSLFVIGCGGAAATPSTSQATPAPRATTASQPTTAPAAATQPQPTSADGFIFDMVGVITDTAEYHYRGWKRLADEEGWRFDRAANEQLRGVSRRESLLRLLGARSNEYTETQLQEFMERKNRYYVESIRAISPCDLLPGAKPLLQEIHVARLVTALASASKNACEVVARLGIQPLFKAITDGRGYFFRLFTAPRTPPYHK